MDRAILLFLASILAGFALLRMPLADTPLESIEPVTTLLGLVAVLVFSLVILYKAVMALIGK
ncbi:hypothetical protein [Bacillus kwashiorkori]|uniref:hypothetical protein n=1 Tax=Bacillus kwashiorkori TaxID=1522318 RepID=UPI00078531D9|nr:hypothetical protein [Bacillus kwashiorkori]